MALPVWVPGQVLAAADVNRWFVPLLKNKAVDQSVTSSAVLVDDNDLQIAVEANAIYTFSLRLEYTGAAAGKLAMQFTGPAAASMTSVIHCTDISATTGTIGFTALTTRNGALPSTLLPAGAVGAADIGLFWDGTLVTGVTAGTFKLRWSQSVSSATATTLRAGSSLTLVRAG